MQVSAQVSLYPLGQSSLGPAIEAALQAFGARGLDYRVGSMSTLVAGEAEAVFEALRDAFQTAAAHGGTVMVLTVSNACPALPPQEKQVRDA
jgi:uncharacterized protein YqgV (UPF0045/DUF77 family)